MDIYRIFFNPFGGNGTGEKNAKSVGKKLSGNVVTYHDITDIKDLTETFSAVPKEEKIVLVGGDGTLNRFINAVDVDALNYDVYYSGAGTGNDFLTDIGKKGLDKPFLLNPYLKDLPYVDIKGHTYRFINGIGFGLDGYCCAEANRQRQTARKRPISYTTIALKGLLHAYTPTNAVVIVDGATHAFRKVWMAPTMFGRYFGGGMIPTPGQIRQNIGKTMTALIMYGYSKLGGLLNFGRLFTGTLGKCAGHSFLRQARDIIVTFDRPTAVQIDGETITDVLTYHAYTK